MLERFYYRRTRGGEQFEKPATSKLFFRSPKFLHVVVPEDEKSQIDAVLIFLEALPQSEADKVEWRKVRWLNKIWYIVSFGSRHDFYFAVTMADVDHLVTKKHYLGQRSDGEYEIFPFCGRNFRSLRLKKASEDDR